MNDVQKPALNYLQRNYLDADGELTYEGRIKAVEGKARSGAYAFEVLEDRIKAAENRIEMLTERIAWQRRIERVWYRAANHWATMKSRARWRLRRWRRAMVQALEGDE